MKRLLLFSVAAMGSLVIQKDVQTRSLFFSLYDSLWQFALRQLRIKKYMFLRDFVIQRPA